MGNESSSSDAKATRAVPALTTESYAQIWQCVLAADGGIQGKTALLVSELKVEALGFLESEAMCKELQAIGFTANTGLHCLNYVACMSALVTLSPELHEAVCTRVLGNFDTYRINSNLSFAANNYIREELSEESYLSALPKELRRLMLNYVPPVPILFASPCALQCHFKIPVDMSHGTRSYLETQGRVAYTIVRRGTSVSILATCIDSGQFLWRSAPTQDEACTRLAVDTSGFVYHATKNHVHVYWVRTVTSDAHHVAACTVGNRLALCLRSLGMAGCVSLQIYKSKGAGKCPALEHEFSGVLRTRNYAVTCCYPLQSKDLGPMIVLQVDGIPGVHIYFLNTMTAVQVGANLPIFAEAGSMSTAWASPVLSGTTLFYTYYQMTSAILVCDLKDMSIACQHILDTRYVPIYPLSVDTAGVVTVVHIPSSHPDKISLTRYDHTGLLLECRTIDLDEPIKHSMCYVLVAESYILMHLVNHIYWVDVRSGKTQRKVLTNELVSQMQVYGERLLTVSDGLRCWRRARDDASA